MFVLFTLISVCFFQPKIRLPSKVDGERITLRPTLVETH
jgi:hypothetical protein